MPATYAHLQFCRQMVSRLPEGETGKVLEYFQLFQVGSHGPDPLFYCNPFWVNDVGRLGNDFHQMTGREFFGPIVKKLRKTPDPEATAFAWGLLTHYCLDSHCHPYVNRVDEEGLCGHSELETEFDRMLMEGAGEERPHRKDLSRHLKLDSRESALAAECFPGITGAQMRRSVENMGLFLRILGSRTIISRELLEGVMPMLGDLKQFLMSRHKVDRLVPMTAELLRYYSGAQEAFPALALQFQSAIQKGTDLGEDFAPIFG